MAGLFEIEKCVYIVYTSKINSKTRGSFYCAISTSIRKKLSEVPVNNLNQPSVVTAHMIHTLSWKERRTKFIATAEDGVMTAVLQRLIQLIGADKILLGSVGLSR